MGSHHPLRIAQEPSFRVAVQALHFVECVAAIPPPSSFGGSLPWEPFRPWGLMSTEGICLGFPCPWLGQMKGLRFCGGDKGLGVQGRAPSAPERGPWRGRKHIGFCSLTAPRGRLSWPVECRAAGSLPGVAVGAGGHPNGPPSTAHSYLQALQRKTNDSLGTVGLIGVFFLNCINSS